MANLFIDKSCQAVNIWIAIDCIHSRNLTVKSPTYPEDNQAFGFENRQTYQKQILGT
jgi:hypothetical protein